MTFPARYAVVLGPDTLPVQSSARRPFNYAVCVIEGDSATCHMLASRADVEALVGQMPCSPSSYGNGAALPSFSAEAEALAILGDELSAAEASFAPARLPHGFLPAMPRLQGGLSARLTDYGLDLAVSLELAAGLGWREGDGLALGVSQCGKLLAIAKGPGGAMLASNFTEPGKLHLDRDLSGVPLGFTLGETPWTMPQYHAADGAVVIAVSDLLPGEREAPLPIILKPVLADVPPFKMPGRHVLLLVTASAAASAAGSILMAHWL